MDDKLKKAIEANTELKKDISALKLEIKKMATEAAGSARSIESKDKLLAGNIESINALKKTISELESATTQAQSLQNGLTKAKAERDEALEVIAELSGQVADQAEVKTETEILVKVAGKKYMLNKGDLHTVDGIVTAEKAAKDEAFLEKLINQGAGNIRPFDK